MTLRFGKHAQWIAVLFAGSALTYGTDFAVSSDAAFKEALQNAQPGDFITLDASQTFTGGFVLPEKSGNLPITIRTSRYSELENRRILPSDAKLLAKIVSPSGGPAIAAASRSKSWRLLGLDISTTKYATQLVELGRSEELTVEDLPQDFELDRVYVHASAEVGGKRGVQLNCRRGTVRNSYISGFWSDIQDAQGILGWNGPGPFEIINNYIEASGENVMFGSAVPSIPNMVPSDIRVTGNHFAKPESWVGTSKIVKNIFELKNAQRVFIEGNIFENNWVGGQAGIAIVFTVRAEYGKVPWATVRDVTFQNNILRRTSGGMSFLSKDDASNLQGSGGNFRIYNNFFDIGNVPASWGAPQNWMMVLGGNEGLVIDHNTVMSAGASGFGLLAGPTSGFVLTNNIFPHNLYGIFGNNVGYGVAALNEFVPGYDVRRNVIVNNPAPSLYKASASDKGTFAENYFPADLNTIRFQNAAQGQFTLRNDSPYKSGGLDKQDIGADMSQIEAATAHSIKGDIFPQETKYFLNTAADSGLLTASGATQAVWELSNRGNVSDWIGIFDASLPDNSSPVSIAQTNGEASGTVTIQLPDQPGAFELRYVTFEGKTAATKAITVGPGNPSKQTMKKGGKVRR